MAASLCHRAGRAWRDKMRRTSRCRAALPRGTARPSPRWSRNMNGRCEPFLRAWEPLRLRTTSRRTLSSRRGERPDNMTAAPVIRPGSPASPGGAGSTSFGVVRARSRALQADPGANSNAAEVSDMLARLSEKERASLVLCDGHGWTHQEAAELLGLPLGTLKSTVARAKVEVPRDVERNRQWLTNSTTSSPKRSRPPEREPDRALRRARSGANPPGRAACAPSGAACSRCLQSRFSGSPPSPLRSSGCCARRRSRRSRAEFARDSPD